MQWSWTSAKVRNNGRCAGFRGTIELSQRTKNDIEISSSKNSKIFLTVLFAGQKATVRMEQWTGSKLGKEYIKAIYCHPAYLTYIQSTSREIWAE